MRVPSFLLLTLTLVTLVKENVIVGGQRRIKPYKEAFFRYNHIILGNIINLTVEESYVCRGSMINNPLNSSEILFGICRFTTNNEAGALAVIDRDLKGPVRVLAGNASQHGVPAIFSDGVGAEVYTRSPEYFIYNDMDKWIYFSDNRQCVRRFDPRSGKVESIIAFCGTSNPAGTLDLSPELTRGQRLIFGLELIPNKKLAIISVVNIGVYVYDYEEPTTSRLLIDLVDLSVVVSDSTQQIVYDPETQWLWHKVSYGINFYNMTEITVTDGIITSDNGSLNRLVSAAGDANEDDTAYYHDPRFPVLGQTNARLLWRPDGKALGIIDMEEDNVFLLNVDRQNGMGNNKTYQQLLQRGNCSRDTVNPIRVDVNNCTNQAFSDGLWFNNSCLMVYERLEKKI